MARVKKTRKQLLNEPDEFISFSSKMMKFGMDHRTKLAWAVTAVFVAIALTAGIQYYQTRMNRKSLVLLENNLRHFEEVLQKDGPEAAQKAVQEEFQQLLDRYDSNTGGKFGRIIYGDICYYAGQLEKAISLYEKALEDFRDNPAMNAIVANNLAYAQEKTGKTDKAIEHFESIVSSSSGLMKDDARYNLGQLYELTGNREKSLEMYKKIQEEKPNFVYGDLVRERIAAATEK